MSNDEINEPVECSGSCGIETPHWASFHGTTPPPEQPAPEGDGVDAKGTARAYKETIQANAALAALVPGLVDTLQEIMNSGVEFDDERMHYVVMQVDREDIANAKRLIAAARKAGVE